ncbi:MAG: heme-degrading domain-containing protein [Spirochaetales bacterium]|jgi:uncharacterized protein (UPF0303 family)
MEDIMKNLLEQEQALQFIAFDENTAWELGSVIVAEARARALPIAVDIRRGERQLFHASLKGASLNNDRWMERKIRTVNLVGHSSYYVNRLLESLGKTISEKYFVSPQEFAAAGGCFPIIVKGTGMVGTAAVSGLTQEEDHQLVMECIAALIKKQAIEA